MTVFILFVRGEGRALTTVEAETLPDAEAMGRALYDRDVIAYHVAQMPHMAIRLLTEQAAIDAEAAACHP